MYYKLSLGNQTFPVMNSEIYFSGKKTRVFGEWETSHRISVDGIWFSGTDAIKQIVSY